MPRKLAGFYFIPVLAVLLGGVLSVPSAFSQYAPGGAMLKGAVMSSDGKPMEGVTVSIREVGRSFVTTVFSDHQGTYLFPTLEKGKYKLWAQAVGFEAARSDVEIAGGQTQQLAALELTPMKDFALQLSGREYVASLSGSDPQDLRMKQIFVNNCTACHPSGFPLQNRFDANGWSAVVNLMTKFSSEGYLPPNAHPNPVTSGYKEELVAYLTKVRGPDSPFIPKPLPRPEGDATKVVITEFDLPRPEAPGSILKFDGSDWSDGTPSRYASRASHDLAMDHNGNIFWADDIVPERTIGKLDPRSGEVTVYKYSNKDGNAVGTHSIITAPDGLLWMNTQRESTFMSFDPKTGEFKNYPRPEGMPRVGGTVAVDSKSNPWAEAAGGAITLDAETGKYTFYKAIHSDGVTYGATVDSEDNAWITFPGLDTLEVVGKNGNVGEVVLPALKSDSITDRDREIAANARQSMNNATTLIKAPRRVAGDRNGNYVWVAEFTGNRLARIDIHTKEVKEYPMPHPYSQPYAVNVDKNHMVWINMINADAVAKFDPNTEKFTEYQLPTRGTEARHILTDNSTDPPTIWVPYNRENKVARLQFK